MPPTIQGEQHPQQPPPPRRDHSSRSHQIEKKSELYSCRVKYNNTLPDIPFDPKFIAYPFDINRYVQYKPTSLEKNFKSELLTEVDLGVPIELIDNSVYKINPKDQLEAADERLLEEETAPAQNSKRSKQHAKNISWLRRTEYISSELGRYGLSNDKSEIKIGAHIKKLMKEEDLYRDRESQIKAIEKTFEDNKVPIDAHHSKQGVHKVAEYPVYPDFKLWAHPYAQVIFDADPAPKDRSTEDQLSDMSQAMIRGMMDESGNQFVAYFLPTEETRRKRKLDAEQDIEFNPEQEYHFKLTREYGWTVKNKASKGYEETYFFIFRPNDNGVYYNELETRVRLSKRRKIGGSSSQNVSPLTNSVLVVTHRDFNANEQAAQENRLTQLEPSMPEEDDDEEEEEEENVEEDDEGEDDEEGGGGLTANDVTENNENKQEAIGEKQSDNEEAVVNGGDEGNTVESEEENVDQEQTQNDTNTNDKLRKDEEERNGEDEDEESSSEECSFAANPTPGTEWHETRQDETSSSEEEADASEEEEVNETSD